MAHLDHHCVFRAAATLAALLVWLVTAAGAAANPAMEHTATVAGGQVPAIAVTVGTGPSVPASRRPAPGASEPVNRPVQQAPEPAAVVAAPATAAADNAGAQLTASVTATASMARAAAEGVRKPIEGAMRGPRGSKPSPPVRARAAGLPRARPVQAPGSFVPPAGLSMLGPAFPGVLRGSLDTAWRPAGDAGTSTARELPGAASDVEASVPGPAGPGTGAEASNASSSGSLLMTGLLAALLIGVPGLAGRFRIRGVGARRPAFAVSIERPG